LEHFGCPAVSLSETFADGIALLRAAEEHRLEGVVSKHRDAPNRSGDCRDWRTFSTSPRVNARNIGTSACADRALR
jgi:hypothetical protein